MGIANLAEKIDAKRLESSDDLVQLRREIQMRQDPNQVQIVVCHGTGCLVSGSPAVTRAFKKVLGETDIEAKVMPGVKTTGCQGFCSRGPLVTIMPQGIFYERVSPKDVEDIVEQTVKNGKPVERLLYKDVNTGEPLQTMDEIPFYNLQTRNVLKNIGTIDPTDIYDYIAVGGYQALAKALTTMTPEQVLEEVEKSGIRGRGGAGFPAGRKWRGAVQAKERKNQPLYVVVNGDEGDPGAFMDGSVMEGDPHAVLEGLILGAYAMGSEKGYMYVRAEYPLAIQHLEMAMAAARELGLLGDNILNTGFCFDAQINRGAGAFVCGESTALFTSIEGKAGEPRPKYVRSVEEGLWGCPTVLNNVETWANIPKIIDKGAEWYASIGSPNNTGTKVFSLVGKVNNVGLVEVPLGTSLSTIIEDIGGGIPGGGEFKAVQTGGPSGGCIPYKHKDAPVDYDSLTKLGSMMGSGGMIVMDKRDCVVDVARYFLKFLEEESCGKCNPCRLGLTRMREILDDFSKGCGSEQDIEDLMSLATSIQDGALCALGTSAPNPVLTTLHFFKDEYLAHIKDQKCPAGVCKDLITYSIDPDACTGCGACAKQCPNNAITGEKKEPHTIDTDACIRCGICEETCKFNAVLVS
ncbi:Putative NADH-quinone oxidoreductase, NADH-binding subunit NuoF [Desulfatibacillum aliphaticivorans]|jgi:NADH:ubiquinone oxidoreductase subunit F (NADH-binding)/(2Fe-2S) ferredoxin/Pyruvate/2-oxoacid:ferredoxin oxidoreductase delta subunit|uniref:NADH-quinone oxidoreductase, NADH-binding subunit NuoF n=2 Tax=Desulfatibacillum TaxID=218207 RepID=B8FIH4_DESAL|nr:MULTISPECIES: NADH-ubiquinone oxidoreductase-F iron-sulfur binding region domain-containing protein [Desulfatibacillum]ACL03964.1 Putative NADH-quinone oxidoreductase, NADH-binding subunit NuoF [Desulfatibacillum aliphaticivorans]SHL05186.1 NADH-quinone oxidoreductase subunit F [Desulfatibacillum alkenivorans DSM 16219]